MPKLFNNIPKVNDLVYVDYKLHKNGWVTEDLGDVDQTDFPARVTEVKIYSPYAKAENAEIHLLHPSGKQSQYTATANTLTDLTTKGIRIFGPETLSINFPNKQTPKLFEKVTTDEL